MVWQNMYKSRSLLDQKKCTYGYFWDHMFLSKILTCASNSQLDDVHHMVECFFQLSYFNSISSLTGKVVAISPSALLRFDNKYLTTLHTRLVYEFRFHWRYIILCKMCWKLGWWSLLSSPPIFFVLFIYFWRRLFPYLVNYTYLRDAIYCSIEVSMF